MRLLRRNTELVKLIMDMNIKENDLCVDLTLGDGNDSLYMYNLKGKVIAFDIQKEAIESSEKLFKDNNIEIENNDRIKFILDSHSNLDNYVSLNDKIKFATFNLGYLPSGDKSIITKYDTTLEALNKTLNRLDDKGIISIICYYDHEGGMEEKIKVDEYLLNLDDEKYEVVKMDKYNSKKNVPINYFIYKK